MDRAYFQQAVESLVKGCDPAPPQTPWMPLHTKLKAGMIHPSEKLSLEFVNTLKSMGNFKGFDRLAVEAAWSDGFNEGFTAAMADDERRPGKSSRRRMIRLCEAVMTGQADVSVLSELVSDLKD